MTTNHCAEIFDAKVALEHTFDEIAKRCKHCNQNRQQQNFADAVPGIALQADHPHRDQSRK